VKGSSRRPSVAVIGLGLIGGSLGLALRRRGHHVTGWDRSLRVRRAALRRGVVSRVTDRLRDAVVGSDVVVLCLPVQALARSVAGIAPWIPVGAVLTDTTSVKAPVVALMKRRLPRPGRFVGGHPMAGSERSGIAAASPALFKGRTVVLTPVGETIPAASAVVTRLWQGLGARVIRLSPGRHDAAAARVSHVPHALAVTQVLDALADPVASRMIAGGFFDATRVAAASPELWEGIFRANAEHLARALRARSRVEHVFARAVAARDPGPLRAMLRRAARLRRTLSDPRR